MDYRAHFYDPYLNRFIQPDTIVPGADDPQSLNRYAYTRNSPIMRIDPTGHMDMQNQKCTDDGYCNKRVGVQRILWKKYNVKIYGSVITI